MMKKLKLILLCFFIFFYSISSFASFTEDINEIAADFLYYPKMTFLDIQYNVEDNFPTWNENSFELGTNLFMNALTIANFNIKTEISAPDTHSPRLTLGLSAWYFWGLHIVPSVVSELSDAESMMAFGGNPFFTISHKFSDSMELFTGAKITTGYVSVDLRGLNSKDAFKSVSYIDDFYIDPAVYVGMGIDTGKKSKLAVQVGYQIIENRIFTKLMWIGETWDFGLGFYPDSAIIIHPIINIRF